MANFYRIDVIHTAGFNASLIGRILKIIFRKRWVASTHAIYEFKRNSLKSCLIKWILDKADTILTLSEPSRQELINIGVEPEKLINQITWVDQNIFKPMDKDFCRQKIKHKNNFVVLFIGRLLPIKGVEDLVEVASQSPFIDYIFIGDGPLGGFLRRKASELNNISFLSWVENNELPIYYNAADVFIMPSQYKEGLGRVTVEALSCGTPVICSNLGGLADILNQSISVLINPTKDNIKSAILDLYNNPEKLAPMRREAPLFARKVFSPNNIEVITSAYGN